MGLIPRARGKQVDPVLAAQEAALEHETAAAHEAVE
jgi:hypothetical protein